MLEAPLEWQGLRLAPGRGASWLQGWRDGPAAVPAAADRTERVRRPGGGQAGGTPLRLRQEDLPEREGPETLAAVWYGRAAEAEDQHGTLVACYNGFGALPGALPLWRRAWHAGLGGPWGRSCWTMSRRSGGRRGPGREGGALPDPCPAGRTGRRGSCCALLRALCEGSGGRGAPRDKGGAEWRSEPSSWNT